MNIYFTFDYELFFGSNSGSVENSIIKPTNRLIEIANKYGVAFTFFVDSGFLIKLDEYRKRFHILNEDYNKVVSQIKLLDNLGHSIQLHIHPHWEDSYFDGKKWIIDTKRYRLQQFNQEEIDNIVAKYKKVLTDIVGDKVFAYRAGGWCIQPFDKLAPAFKKHNIYLDSTVFLGGKNLSNTHYFDFRKAPKKDMWKFSKDPLIEDKNGYFSEIPISSKKLSPLFFWKFAFSKKFATKKHKIYGDGKPVGASKKDIAKMLLIPSYSVVSCDGYKSTLLESIYKEYDKNNFVIIGHPKAQSEYSLEQIDKFISKYSKDVKMFRRRGL